MKKVELIGFKDCPNIAEARDALGKLSIKYIEVCQDTLPEKHPYQKFSSPTILVDQVIVFGSDSTGRGCSIGNVQQEVVNALEKIFKLL